MEFLLMVKKMFGCNFHPEVDGNVYYLQEAKRRLCDECVEILITVGRIEYDE